MGYPVGFLALSDSFVPWLDLGFGHDDFGGSHSLISHVAVAAVMILFLLFQTSTLVRHSNQALTDTLL